MVNLFTMNTEVNNTDVVNEELVNADIEVNTDVMKQLTW